MQQRQAMSKEKYTRSEKRQLVVFLIANRTTFVFDDLKWRRASKSFATGEGRDPKYMPDKPAYKPGKSAVKRSRLFPALHHPLNIFTQNVEFQVHALARSTSMKICILDCMRYDRHFKFIHSEICDR